MYGIVTLTVLVLSFIGLQDCAVIRAEGACGLPLDLPKITVLTLNKQANTIDFQVSLESAAEVKIEKDSLRWHASKDYEYMLLPVQNGVSDVTVRDQITRDAGNRYLVTSRLQAPYADDMSYSLLLKLILPCNTIHMAVHQPAGEVELPIYSGRVESMPPAEIRNPTGPVEVEYVITTPKEKKSGDPILRGPLNVDDLTNFNVPWQGEWIRAESQEVQEEGGRWKEVTRGVISPVDTTALYEYDTSHAYTGGRVGVSFVFPLLVIRDEQSGPKVGFLTCDPRQKLTSEKINGEITFYQPYGQASCLKFDYFNTKNAAISMRTKPCSRGQGERLNSAFGQRGNFQTNYAEQTYLLAPQTQSWESSDDCYELRAVNKFGGELLRFRIKFYTPPTIQAEAVRISDTEVQLTCSGRSGGHMKITMYQGNIEEYYNPHRLVDDGVTAAEEWQDLMESDLISGPIMGNASPGGASKTMKLRLPAGHVVSMNRNQQSLFCVIKTKQQFLLEKFTLTAQHLGETIEI